jgi:hypothetical protein
MKVADSAGAAAAIDPLMAHFINGARAFKAVNAVAMQQFHIAESQ